MTLGRSCLLALLACTAPACTKSNPARPQLLVVLDTDVPVTEFADRVRIELFDATGTESLAVAREVVLSSADDLPVSFGFRAPDDASTGSARLRVRVYRSGDVVFDADGAEPAAFSTIDRVVNLEADPGVLGRVLVTLHGDCIGFPADVAAGLTCVDSGAVVSAPEPEPVVAGLTPIPPSVAGTWAGAQRVPCTGAARPETGLDDEDTCVPGGAFYFGTVQGQSWPDCLGECDRQPPQLAVISPFFMDRYEVSVRRFRAALNDASKPFVPPTLPALPGQITTPLIATPTCTWTASPGPNEELPVTCVTLETARAFCQWEGGDLPTEAGWEFAASRAFQTRKEPYPWGSAPPTCGGTMYGMFYLGECIPDGGNNLTAQSPLAVTAPFPDVDASCTDAGCSLDQTPSVDGSAPLVGLAGNVWELVRDQPAPAQSPCWAQRRDPVCLDGGFEAGDDAGPDLRGGGWVSDAELLITSMRTGRYTILQNTNSLATELGGVGFRCTRPGP